jgi:DNA repair protein RadA/Sms
VQRRAPAAAPVTAAEIDLATQARSSSGLDELDRVLGGGLVPGGLALLAGDPGIGKSTLLLQAASSFAAAHGVCLYVTGEESLSQVAMRSRRLEALSSRLLLFAETEVYAIAQQVEQTSPRLLVVDSIQSMYSSNLDSLPGTVSQVRECAARLLSLAKDLGLPTFLIGHVTKDGAVAGPRLLEHMVDTLLSLEGDRHSGYRLLRCMKNRFGSTDELGLFQMTESGLEGIPDASAALLAERRAGTPGSSVVAALEGSRPLLVEVQALVARAAPHMTPRRSVSGLDYNRTCLILAVLEKRMGIPLATEDVFVNVPGGVRVTEPASDLGLALAVASSYQDVPMPPDMACVGEVGRDPGGAGVGAPAGGARAPGFPAMSGCAEGAGARPRGDGGHRNGGPLPGIPGGILVVAATKRACETSNIDVAVMEYRRARRPAYARHASNIE